MRLTLRDKSGWIIKVGSQVRFPITDEEMAGHPLYECGDVVEIDPVGSEVFVSQPGNMGAEGWVPAEWVERVDKIGG